MPVAHLPESSRIRWQSSVSPRLPSPLPPNPSELAMESSVCDHSDARGIELKQCRACLAQTCLPAVASQLAVDTQKITFRCVTFSDGRDRESSSNDELDPYPSPNLKKRSCLSMSIWSSISWTREVGGQRGFLLSRYTVSEQSRSIRRSAHSR